MDRGLCSLSTLQQCPGFILRYKYTDLCLSRIDGVATVDQCLPETPSHQYWYHNSNTGAIEGIGQGRSTIDVVNATDATQDHYVLMKEDPNLQQVAVSPLRSTIVCATEQESCVCSGDVFYGRSDEGFSTLLESGSYLTQNVASSIPCESINFGGDPSPGSIKRCW